jgi:hypothetical protein
MQVLLSTGWVLSCKPGRSGALEYGCMAHLLTASLLLKWRMTLLPLSGSGRRYFTRVVVTCTRSTCRWTQCDCLS